jgi:hypothetical protein
VIGSWLEALGIEHNGQGFSPFECTFESLFEGRFESPDALPFSPLEPAEGEEHDAASKRYDRCTIRGWRLSRIYFYDLERVAVSMIFEKGFGYSGWTKWRECQ